MWQHLSCSLAVIAIYQRKDRFSCAFGSKGRGKGRGIGAKREGGEGGKENRAERCRESWEEQDRALRSKARVPAR